MRILNVSDHNLRHMVDYPEASVASLVLEFISESAANRDMPASDRLSRRTVLATIGTLAAPLIATSSALGARTENSAARTVRYIGVVDRIVDGKYVVILLERDGRVVDQLVVDVDRFDSIEPRDVLLVVVKDGTLFRYHHLPRDPRRGSCGE